MRLSSQNAHHRTLRSGRLMVQFHLCPLGGEHGGMLVMSRVPGGGNVSANTHRPGQFRVHQQAPGGMPVPVPVRV